MNKEECIRFLQAKKLNFLPDLKRGKEVNGRIDGAIKYIEQDIEKSEDKKNIEINILKAKTPNFVHDLIESDMNDSSDEAMKARSDQYIHDHSGCAFHTYDELVDEGKVSKLCLTNFTLYAVIYKETFGKYPEGATVLEKEEWVDGPKPDYSEEKIRGLIYKEKAEVYARLRDRKKLDKLMEMSYDELAQQDLLKELKTLSPAAFEAKKKEYYED